MRSFGLFGELPKRRWHRLARHIAVYLRSASGSSWDLFIWESPGGSPGGSPMATDFDPICTFSAASACSHSSWYSRISDERLPNVANFSLAFPGHQVVTQGMFAWKMSKCSILVAYLYLALGRFYTGPKSFKLLLCIISFHWNILQVQTSRSSSYIEIY